MSTPQPDALSRAGPVALALYRDLLAAIAEVGPFAEEIKKTSIHLVRNSAFLGIHPRKQSLILTLKSDAPLASRRIRKSDQVSRNRFHHEVTLHAASEIDPELLGWIREAYELCG